MTQDKSDLELKIITKDGETSWLFLEKSELVTQGASLQLRMTDQTDWNRPKTDMAHAQIDG